eukprot:SAG31_NODE_1089_length_9972_cov_4.602856_12_plen_464_part_00
MLGRTDADTAPENSLLGGDYGDVGKVVRDMAIVDAVQLDDTTWTYDLLTIEGRSLQSRLRRYRVRISTPSDLADSPTVTVCGTAACSLADTGGEPEGKDFLMAAKPDQHVGGNTVLSDLTGVENWDLYSMSVKPGANSRPSRPGCSLCLYVTDYSYNVILRLDLPAWEGTVSDSNQVPMTSDSVQLLGTKDEYMPKGFPMFLPGPFAHTSRVEGIRDLVSGQTGYLKITANDIVGQPAMEDDAGHGAALQVIMTGTIDIGGQDVEVTIPGTVLARTEGIYRTGCEGAVCARNIYWATYRAARATRYTVSVTMGFFQSHVEGSPAQMNVFPGPTATVVVAGDDRVTVSAGDTIDLTITAFDVEGNRRAVGGDDSFRIALRETATSPNVIDKANTYEVTPSSTPVQMPANSLASSCEDVGGQSYWRGTADYQAYRKGTYRERLAQIVATCACNKPIRPMQRAGVA